MVYGPNMGRRLKARAAVRTKKAIKAAERRSVARAFGKVTKKAVGPPASPGPKVPIVTNPIGLTQRQSRSLETERARAKIKFIKNSV